MGDHADKWKWVPSPERCKDDNHDLEPFAEPYSDELVAKLTTSEVRERFPRRQCKQCGTIVYESFGHYVAGDW